MHKIIREARPTFDGERVDSRYEDTRKGVIYIYIYIRVQLVNGRRKRA